MRAVSSERETKSTLNLGLGEILSQADKADPIPQVETTPPTHTDEASSAGSTNLSAPAPSVPKNEFESLADTAKWSELAARSEHSTKVEARLWWARAQCELAAMPLSIIAAPLEQSLSEISRDTPAAAVVELATDVATRISQALIDRKELNLATALLEAGRRISPRLDAKFRAAATLELAALNELPARELDKHRIARKTYLLGFVGEMQKSQPLSATPSKISAANAKPKRSPDSLISRVLLGVALISLLTLALLFYFGAFNQAVVAVDGGTLAVSVSRPDLDPPSLKLAILQRTSATSLLEAVLIEDEQRRGIEHNGANNHQANTADVGLIINDQPAARPQKNEPPVSAQLPNVPAPKERINTTSPIEPRDIRDAGIRARDRSERPERADELFEKPPGQRDNGSSYSGDTQRYRVLVRTEVRAIPSFSSTVLQRLQRGDPVAVEEREGQWFRIRGRNGKSGYIPAQDVEPE